MGKTTLHTPTKPYPWPRESNSHVGTDHTPTHQPSHTSGHASPIPTRVQTTHSHTHNTHRQISSHRGPTGRLEPSEVSTSPHHVFLHPLILFSPRPLRPHIVHHVPFLPHRGPTGRLGPPEVFTFPAGCPEPAPAACSHPYPRPASSSSYQHSHTSPDQRPSPCPATS